MRLLRLLPLLFALAFVAPAAGYWQSRDSNYNTNVVSGGGGGGSCTPGTNATIFLARTSGLDQTHTDAYCVLINWLDTKGLFTLTDQLLVFATQDATTSFLNLVSVNYTATGVNSPTFTADVGYTGGGTKQIDTHFNASTAIAAKFTNTDCSALIFGNTSWASGQDSGAVVGYLTNSSDAVGIYSHYIDDKYYIGTQNAGSGSSGPYTLTTHFIGFSKTNPGSALIYQTTTSSSASGGSGSTSLINDNFGLLGDNAAGFRPYNGTLRAWWVGGGLSATQEADLYNGLCTFLTTVSGSC